MRCFLIGLAILAMPLVGCEAAQADDEPPVPEFQSEQIQCSHESTWELPQDTVWQAEFCSPTGCWDAHPDIRRQNRTLTNYYDCAEDEYLVVSWIQF